VTAAEKNAGPKATSNSEKIFPPLTGCFWLILCVVHLAAYIQLNAGCRILLASGTGAHTHCPIGCEFLEVPGDT
jgi:hypothetical protein